MQRIRNGASARPPGQSSSFPCFLEPEHLKSAPPSTLLCCRALRLHESIVVALGAGRVSHGERRQRIVHGVVFSHIPREHRRICRARMGACERAPAQMRIAGQRSLFHQLADRVGSAAPTNPVPSASMPSHQTPMAPSSLPEESELARPIINGPKSLSSGTYGPVSATYTRRPRNFPQRDPGVRLWRRRARPRMREQ